MYIQKFILVFDRWGFLCVMYDIWCIKNRVVIYDAEVGHGRDNTCLVSSMYKLLYLLKSISNLTVV